MTRVLFIIATLALMAAAAFAEPINRYCPIGKEPIQPNGGVITYQGREIGFCCPGCDDEFLAWTDEKKAEFVRLAMAGNEPQAKEPAVPTEPAAPAAPSAPSAPSAPALMSINAYALDTCPVSGEKLGDGAVTRDYEGRQVRFCCENCIPKYEADPAEYNAKIDEQTAARQRLGYPMSTCPISGESLVTDGKFTGVEVVKYNRLVRFCCKNCAAKFDADPAPVFAKLDAAIVAAQRAAYPLETCPVSGESFEADAKPVDLIYANRLYRLCCKMCAGEFAKEPNTHAAALDAAYADAQRAGINTCPLSGEDLDDSAVELVAGTRLYRFCCKNCAAKFKADPDAYQSN